MAEPAEVDTSAVMAEVPYGTVTVKVEKGGLSIPSEPTPNRPAGDGIVIANAAILVSFDDN